MADNRKVLNILIVDDDSFVLDMYSVKFKESGTSVHACMSGAKAIEVVKQGFKPDIVLLDIDLIDMDGIEIIETLNVGGMIGDGVIIVLSNESDRAKIDKAMEVGASGYILKSSLTPSEVLREVFRVYEENKK